MLHIFAYTDRLCGTRSYHWIYIIILLDIRQICENESR
jgi:hypothetical protein